jgi:hypothetical protein
MHQEKPAPDGEAAAPGGTSPGGRAVRSAHGDVSRTWEMELLISGAVVFALLQMPAVLDGLLDRVEPQLSRGMQAPALLGYVYLKAILYALIVFFGIHLISRAYWIGLIGLDSVFPGGIRWENVRYGPIAHRVYRRELPTLPRLIERTDNFCSVLFSFAFLFVILFAISLVAAAAVVGVSLLATTFIPGPGSRRLLQLFVVLVLLPMLLLIALDKALAGRIQSGGSVARALERGITIQIRVMLARLYSTILMTLFSNVRKTVMYPVFYVILVGLVTFVLADFLTRRDALVLGGARFLPDRPGTSAVSHAHYENLRGDAEPFGFAPRIQSDIIVDPYIRLFIPYRVDRLDQAVQAHCAGAPPLNRGGLRLPAARGSGDVEGPARLVLACLRDLHAVQLDDRSLEEIDFRFYTHPRTGLRGVIAYIPVDGLPPGRHVLTVRRLPRPDTPDTPPDPPYEIPFWI